jgi:hypothetical protein
MSTPSVSLAEKRPERPARDERGAGVGALLAHVVVDEPGLPGADVGDERIAGEHRPRLDVHGAFPPELDVLDDLALLVDEHDRHPRPPEEQRDLLADHLEERIEADHRIDPEADIIEPRELEDAFPRAEEPVLGPVHVDVEILVEAAE